MDVLGYVAQYAIKFPPIKKLGRYFMKYAKRMLALALIALPILAVAQMVTSRSAQCSTNRFRGCRGPRLETR